MRRVSTTHQTCFTEDTVEAFKTFAGPRPNRVFKLYSDMGDNSMCCISTVNRAFIRQMRSLEGPTGKLWRGPARS
eukprot:2806368-Lingulodinium_polyedra.AAC.1